MANYEKFGFNSVIAKPYKISELSFVLHDVLSKRRDLSPKITYQWQPAVN